MDNNIGSYIISISEWIVQVITITGENGHVQILGVC